MLSIKWFWKIHIRVFIPYQSDFWLFRTAYLYLLPEAIVSNYDGDDSESLTYTYSL